MDWKGKRVVIIGAARQGIALSRYLAQEGAEVVLTDMQTQDQLADARQRLADVDIEWRLGENPLSLLDGAEAVCPSGGVPLNIPLVQEAQEQGILLTNDSQIFMEETPCRVIGITGSAGKTTTTTLVGRIAQAAIEIGTDLYRTVYVGGNIGYPLIAELHEITPDDLAVMELSSYQLDLMRRSPHIAALLNITPNHLDRHGTMAAYTDAKLNIFQGQSDRDLAVLGRDDENAWAARVHVKGRLDSFGLSPLPEGGMGSYLKEDAIWLRTEKGEQEVMPVSEIGLRGEHNLLNVLATCAIAAAAGLSPEAMRAGAAGFDGVPHRLEFVREWGGADWYNDSKATGPESVIKAIEAFDEPLVLLAGGRDKDLPWDRFAKLVGQRVDHLILFGKAGPVIQAALLPDASYTLDVCGGLEEAVHTAAQRAEPGDVVLLSPGGDSFDEFTDFEARGERFKEWVNQLEG